MDKAGSKVNGDNSKLATGSVMSTKSGSHVKGRPSSSSVVKKNTNEFISGQLDPDKIDEYITLLQEFEKTSIAEKKFKDAELAAKRIKELTEQEQEYRKYALQENAENEIRELENINVTQFNEFNTMWDQLIQEHLDNIKQVEEDLLASQAEEERRFDEEIEKIEIPKPKFSSELIENKLILQKLVKAKNYTEAQIVSDKVEAMEKNETDKWNATYKERFIKKKQILLQRHKNELDALRVKLQNSLQEKLRMRQVELQKLLQRFQNIKKTLEQKQGQEMSKIASQSQKSKFTNQSFRANTSGIINNNLNTSQNKVN